MDQWDDMVAALGGSGAVRAAGNQEATMAAASSSPPHSPHNNSDNSYVAAASSTVASPSPIQRLRVQGVPQAQLIQGLHNLREHSKGKDHNTKKSYEPKRAEFLEFCDKVYGFQPSDQKQQVCPEKTIRYMMYVAFREQKKRGKKRDSSNNSKDKFIMSEYVRIFSKVAALSSPDAYPEIEPKNGIGYNVMLSSKAAILQLWKEQHERNVNSYTKDAIFGITFDNIMDHVKLRKPRADKKNFKEKIDHASAPLGAVKHIQDLENYFFLYGFNRTDGRQVFASLRNRYIFLHTCHGILRGESLFKGELSDEFGIECKRDDDPHQFYIAIMQIATGKTNNGVKLFGRVGRHINPSMCSIGAQGFYLMYRFEQSNEMHPIPDFCNNESWYGIKILTDANTKDPTKGITDTTYYSAVNQALNSLGIHSNHFVHIGRVLGSCASEIDEDDSEDLRRLGNWDPKMQEARYSTKLPMKIIRSRAGFQKANGLHYNPRVSLIPSENLQKQIFPWLDEAKEKFYSNPLHKERPTAHHFLDFMSKLRIIILQDAAAMIAEISERAAHPIFMFAVFNTNEFDNFFQDMKKHLLESVSPINTSLEIVLPGVNTRLTGIHSIGSRNSNMLVDLQQQLCDLQEEISDFPETVRDQTEGGLRMVMREFFSYGSTFFQQDAGAVPPPSHHDSPPCQDSQEHAFSILNLNTTDIRHINTPALVPGSNYKLAANPKSASEIWNQWHGIGTYSDMPVEGGIPEMEKQHKTRWRKGYSGPEKKQFSRWKLTIATMTKAKEGKSDDEFLKEMNDLFAINPKLIPFLNTLREKEDSNST
jgi:hypothetical protein